MERRITVRLDADTLAAIHRLLETKPRDKRPSLNTWCVKAIERALKRSAKK